MKRALLQLHIAVFLAGFTGILGRWISLEASLLVWYRLLITVATLTILLLWRRSLAKITVRELVKIFAVGAVVAIHWVSFYASIKHSNVSVALVCFSTLGFFSSMLEPIILKKKIQIAEVLLGLLAILGVYLIFHFDVQYKTGIIFGIIAAILAALFTILNKLLLRNHNAQTVTYYELTGGFIVLSLILPFYLPLFHIDFTLPTEWDWISLLVLSWLCTILAFYLSLTALKKISPFTVNLTYNLEPVYGILLAFIVFQENKMLSINFYLGLLLIAMAVALQMVRMYVRHRKERSTSLVLGA